jgi:hypothetical protein
MRNLKKYLPVLLIVIPVIIAVILRSTGTGHFRYDAAKWAGPSVKAANLITPGMISRLKGDIMVINLAFNRNERPVYPSQIAISPDSVMTRAFMKKTGKNKGPVVLWSDDPAISARIWMLMSQSGIRDLYILVPDTLNETIKEKFRTDSLIRPEL